ncbi:MAG: dockerin type I domain-containing protein [Clostridia bacterium]|nr:dockerin type I domain-containing protein [Clostridia bacterium]
MKQSKRLLSVLLSMLLILSTFTIGVSAYKTSYEEPAGYDSILTPYFTNDQAATALLDMLDDEVFAPMDIHESIVGIDINISSFDTLCDTLDEVMSSTLYGLASGVLNLGDIEKLNVKALRNSSNRRRNANLSDFQLFMVICNCLSLDDNADVLAGIFDGSFSLGFINRWFDLYEEVPMLKNVHGYVCDMVYKLLMNDGQDTGYVEGAADSYNLDNMVQTFLNDRVLTFVFNLLDEETVATVADFMSIPIERDEEGKITNQMGLLSILPSLNASDISLTSTSTYDFIINTVNALVDDIVIPFAGSLILELLKVAPDDYDATETSYFDVAINLFVDYNTLVEAGVVSADTPEDDVNVVEEFLRWKGVENPERPKPIDKLNVALEYIIKVGLKKYIWFEPTAMGSHLQLTDLFAGMFSDLIRMVVPMLPSFTSDFTPLTAEQEAAIETMGDEELFAFLAKMLLEAFVDGVYFPDNCDTIKELATYTLINVCEELVHSENADFQKMIDQGALDPDSDQCLDVAAAVLNYYLVGQTTFESSNLTPSFVELLNDCFETFLGKYVTLFSMYPNASDRQTYANNPWYKLYMSANQWIPLTNIFYGVEDSWYGMQNLFMDSIIGNVLNFDINGLLGIIGRRSDSDLNKPLSKVLSNLLARILNGVFKLPVEKANQSTNDFQLNRLIVPYDYTTLDQILQTKNSGGSLANTGLKNTVRMLMKSLPNITQSGAVAAESLDLICELVGIIDLDQFGYIKRQFANTFTGSYSMNQLKTLYNELKIPDNEGIEYYEDGYTFCHTVDFDPWTYKDFKGALGDAAKLIEQFDNGESVKRADITYAYYYLQHVYDDWLLANQPAANDFYLLRIINNNPRITSNVDGNGDQLYTNRSWDAYVKAYNFATKVVNEYNQYKDRGTLGDYPQSKVNTARSELRDAIRGLKLNAGLGDADYSALIAAIDNLVFLDSPAVFTDKSVQNVVETYNEALKFVRQVWYDADSQAIVDGVTERLNKAYNALVTIPVIDYYDPNETYFLKDEVNSYLYGFEEALYTELDEEDFGDFVTYMDQWLMAYATNGCTRMDIVPTSNGNGTGAKVLLRSDLDGDGVFITEREYTVIFFGDVNGDGLIDGTDAVILRCYASRLLSTNTSNAYIKFAGDVDCDETLSTKDANAVINAGIMKTTIDQAPSARADHQIAFSDIVNK